MQSKRSDTLNVLQLLKLFKKSSKLPERFCLVFFVWAFWLLLFGFFGAFSSLRFLDALAFRSLWLKAYRLKTAWNFSLKGD